MLPKLGVILCAYAVAVEEMGLPGLLEGIVETMIAAKNCLFVLGEGVRDSSVLGRVKPIADVFCTFGELNFAKGAEGNGLFAYTKPVDRN